MPAILEIKDLSLRYNNMVLVDHISVNLNRGQILGIVGESGSGKSLTALSITSLLPENIKVSTGEILYSQRDNSINLLSLGKEDIRRIRGRKIAMIFQEPMTSLNPSMQCGRQVEEGIRAHFNFSSKEIREKTLTLFNEVLLPRPLELFKAYPHQLSGGQRQRVIIALSLCADPEIIVADEPTTALDNTVQKNIIDLLKNLTQKLDLSLIFISHNLRLVKEIANDVVVMRNGKVVEKGLVNKLYHHPSNPYTRGLLACQPPLYNKPYRLLTIRDFEEGKSDSNPIKIPIKKKVQYNIEPMLSIKDLSVAYSIPGGIFLTGKKTYKAINNISFDVFRGETLGLVGESGCGKTTIGKTILKLLTNNEGEILFKGKSLCTLKGNELARFRKSVQVVFQDPFSSLNPRQTILGMLSESLKIHHPGLNYKKRTEKIVDLLLKVGLSEKDLLKYPHQFSGGQRQRISIARSLTPEPELLVLDESVSALDVSVQAQVLNLLNDLKESFGLTYIFISHDLSVVRYMADRIIVMNKGEIEECDFSEKIFNSPVKEYTLKLLEAIPGYQNSL